MPLTRITADAFGVVTILLVFLFAALCLICIYRCFYFWLRIRRGDFLQLGYFNGPWVTRIALILTAIWWGIAEIARLGLLKGEGRVFSGLTWQKNLCKLYIASNLGFTEPAMSLVLVFLLRASLQKAGSGTLSQRWNRRTIAHVLLFSLPIFAVQVALVVIGPMFNKEERSNGWRTKIAKYFTSTSLMIQGNCICTYPLFSTIILGIFHALLIGYVVYVGARMLSLVINKGLRQRVYWLISSLIVFLPLRVLLLGLSVLPHQGRIAYDSILFFAFAVQLCCTTVGIYMLVYCPVADSLALRDVSSVEMEGVPYDDYYSEGVSLIANQLPTSTPGGAVMAP